jgi:ApbE superfamily uncharacterized protein (UPF0280 family)
LKYLIVIQLLLKRKSLFFSNKYKALSDHKEIQPLTTIVEAYELNVAHKLKNAIRDQKAKLLAYVNPQPCLLSSCVRWID